MKEKTPDYMPQLDSLRALAVFTVMIHHWLPGFLGFGPWGDLGVRCFFVLSGFLITGILLRARAAVESGRSSTGWQMRQFYIRRSLRIFPIYYLTLLAGVLVGMAVMRQTFWWHATYCSNIYFALLNRWEGYTSHLWSLSVEEHFYLIWPALVLLLPRKWLPSFFLASIAAGVLTRAGLAATLGPEHITIKVLLPSCLDSLVAGALLAWAFSPASGLARSSANRWLQRSFPAVTALFLARCALDYFGIGKPFLAVAGPLIEAAFFTVVVARCAVGVPGLAGRALNLAPLQYLGRISYGLYLYHMFSGYIAGIIAGKLGCAVPGPGLARFALFFAMSVLAAAISERLIERPCNRLKRFFPSNTGKSERPPAPAGRPASLIPGEPEEAK